MKRLIGLIGLIGLTACGPLPKPPGPPPTPPPAVSRTIAVVTSDHAGVLVVGAWVSLDDTTGPHTAQTNGDGYVAFAGISALLGDSAVHVTAPGCQPYAASVVLSTGTAAANQTIRIGTRAAGLGNAPDIQLPALDCHVDPSTIPLGQLAAIRGAMWPLGTASSCGALPLGPRPGQADNVLATVFITDYTTEQQDCIITELKARGYTHVVMGPLVDSDGYHGIWQPNDWRGVNFERFLDAVEKFYDAGLNVVVFIKPDGWSLDQAKAELTPLLAQPRAQRLIRLAVPMGWEAGGDYEYSSCTWAEAGAWIRAVLPTALTFVHMVADRDAPAGTDARCNDDDHTWNPGGNAAAWARVVPFYHGWLTQSAAFAYPTGTGGDREHPELTNFENWQRQFDPAVRGSYRDRFEHGYAGWPTGSAWGLNQPLVVYAGEYRAYWTFWEHRAEAEGVTWGDAAMKSGAAGYLDGGTVPVLVRQ